MKIHKKLFLIAGAIACALLFLSSKKTVAESKNTAFYSYDDFSEFLKSAENHFQLSSIEFAYIIDDSSVLSNVKLSHTPKRWSLYQINVDESGDGRNMQFVFFALSPTGHESLLFFTGERKPDIEKYLVYEKSSPNMYESKVQSSFVEKIRSHGEDPYSMKAGKAEQIATKSGEKMYDEGKVLNICIWLDDFKNILCNYYPGYNKENNTIGGVKIKWREYSYDTREYHKKLLEELAKNESSPEDERIDLYLVESEFITSIANSNYALDVKKDLGLTDSDLVNQFKYTKQLATDANGNLRAVSWQACPSGIIYRRSIAKALFNTDDPEIVQGKFSSWESFEASALEAKKKGYKIASGYYDYFNLFMNNSQGPLVKDGTVSIPQDLKTWISMSKNFAKKGCTNKANLWSDEQWKGLQSNGKVLCYFGPQWFINMNLKEMSSKSGKGTFGDWALCQGPTSAANGGTWLLAAPGTDNPELIKDIMLATTCDESVLEKFFDDTEEFVNNEAVITRKANSDYKNGFLGGQNHLGIYLNCAKSIDKSNSTPYDMSIYTALQDAMYGYLYGGTSEKNAWKNFKTQIQKIYPDLKFDF